MPARSGARVPRRTRPQPRARFARAIRWAVCHRSPDPSRPADSPSGRAPRPVGMFFAPDPPGRRDVRGPRLKPGWAGSEAGARTRIASPVGHDNAVAHDAKRTVYVGPTREALRQPARHDGPKHPLRTRPARFGVRPFGLARSTGTGFKRATECFWCYGDSWGCNKLPDSGTASPSAAQGSCGPDASADASVVAPRALSGAETA
jgi:hypothetical protein